MKFSKKDIIGNSQEITFKENPTYGSEQLSKYPRIRKVKECEVIGKGSYDDKSGILFLNFKINATLIVPCDITLEDVELPISIDDDMEVSFDEVDDVNVYVVEDTYCNTDDLVLLLMYLEIPLKVVKNGDITYPKGENWQILSEEEYEKMKANQIDPRLAKLKEFQSKN